MTALIIVAIIAIIIIYKVIAGKNNLKAVEYYDKAKEHDRKGNYDQAIEDFTKAIQLSSKNNLESELHWIYKYRGMNYYKKGSYDEAISDYNHEIQKFMESIRFNVDYNAVNKEAIRIVMDDIVNGITLGYDVRSYVEWIAELLVLCGDAYTKKGDNTHAMADYDKAIHYYSALKGGNSLICADIYMKKGDKEAANSIYNRHIWEKNKSLEKKPNDFKTLHSLGQLYVKTGDYNKAIKSFEALLQINQDTVKKYDDIEELNDIKAEASEELEAIKKLL